MSAQTAYRYRLINSKYELYSVYENNCYWIEKINLFLVAVGGHCPPLGKLFFRSHLERLFARSIPRFAGYKRCFRGLKCCKGGLKLIACHLSNKARWVL